MAKKLSYTPLFFFLCITLLVCQSLGLATEKKAVDDDDLNTNVKAEYNAMSGFHGQVLTPHYQPASLRFNGLLFNRRYLQEASLKFNGLLFTHHYLQEAFPRFNGLLFTRRYRQEASPRFKGLLCTHLFLQAVFKFHHYFRGIRGFRPICFIRMGHGATESVEIDNAGAGVVTDDSPPPTA
ncbi:Uncharacterized protein Fot_36059 [Forsythia ovata]|uniref:Uncharacterized protein n=1 Tax=Forsythia ovata TaxID=205694 RepID=A0ABD1SNB8_9LAMI